MTGQEVYGWREARHIFAEAADIITSIDIHKMPDQDLTMTFLVAQEALRVISAEVARRKGKH